MDSRKVFAAVVAFFVLAFGAMLAVNVSASTSGPDGECDYLGEE